MPSFAPDLKQAIAATRLEAIRLGCDCITPEVLFLGLLIDEKGQARALMAKQSIDLTAFKKNLEAGIPAASQESATRFRDTPALLPFVPGARMLLEAARDYAGQFGRDQVLALDLLNAILSDTTNGIMAGLEKYRKDK
jgi:ATP-dependent Clp protease ATP-binding subunit ClpA